MRFEIVNVTPRMAESWLSKNTINRPIRATVVETYANAIRRGEWKLTHQGIAFDKRGELKDGQHRLNAIILAGMPVRMVVIRDVEPETFDAMDLGAKRSPSDVLAVSTSMAAIVAYLCKMDQTDIRGAVTPQMLVPYIAAFRPYVDDLLSSCPATAKAWSTSSVRAAAVLKIADGEPREYVHMVYSALILRDFEMMPPVARSLFRQQLDGIARQGGFDMFSRCSVAFTQDKANYTKLQLKGTEAPVKWARDVIRDVMDGKEKARSFKKKAAPKIVNAKHDLITDVR